MLEAATQGLLGIFAPESLMLMALGAVIGSVAAFLPGLGGPTTLAIALPFVMTWQDPYAVIAFLIAIDAVGNTGNSFTSVLLSVPGGSGAQATILDGYPLAKKGQAARALSASFTASLLGGFVGPIALLAAIPMLRPLVLSFGSPEFFVLTLWGLTMVGVLSGNVPVKGLMAGILGVLIATVGIDPKSGVERFAFGEPYLWDGIHLAIVGLGLFGIAECIDLAARRTTIAERQELGSGFMDGIKDTFRNWWLVIRCSFIGAWVGFLPGLGSSVADWFAYAHAAQTEKNSEGFGKGDIRGVIAPESSNNAKEGGSYIPTLAFGIPGGTSPALILIAFVAVGIQPGPDMLTTQLDFTFGVIWTLTFSNVIAVALCMAFIKPLSRLCFLPFQMVVPLMVVLVFIGAFAANFDAYDLLALMTFGLLGFMMRRHGWPRAPLVLGVVLGQRMELYLWLSYARYGLEWLMRPMVMFLLLIVVVSALYPAFREWSQRKDKGVGKAI